jgi:hypothetical protein
MNFFKKLNLPGNVIKTEFLDELCKLKLSQEKPAIGKKFTGYQTVHYDIERYLDPEIYKIFSKINLQPWFFIHFGTIYNILPQTTLHRDLVQIENKWCSIPAAINWELTPGTTEFSWYKTDSLQELMPDLNSKLVLPGTNYGHRDADYGHRDNRSTENCQLLERTNLQRNTAYLVRTDVPHQVQFTCDAKMRIAISLRWHPHSVSTWDSALEIFKQFIDKD